MIYGVIYKIINVVNNKIYIGQTTNSQPHKRITLHFRVYKNRKDLVALSVKKYSLKNFKWEILCSSCSQENLDWLEKYFISYYDCLSPKGYNLTSGGKSYGKHVPETIQKLSDAHKGIPKTQAHKQAMSKSRKGFDSENRRFARLKNKYITGKKILATNLIDNRELCFYSIGDCAKLLNLKGQNVSECLLNKNGRTQSGGWKFNYISIDSGQNLCHNSKKSKKRK